MGILLTEFLIKGISVKSLNCFSFPFTSSSMHFPLFWQGLLEHALSFDAGHPKEIEIVEKKTSQNIAVTDLVIFVGVIFQTH